MSGETLDISQLCELEWYEWIIFRELVVSFPEDKMVLGIYLGPIIDVGLAMTAKILKPNVEVVHQSKYWALLPEDVESSEHQASWGDFDVSVAIKCGPGAIVEYFNDLGAVEKP